MHFRPYEPLNTCTLEWKEIPPILIPIELLIYSQDTISDKVLEEGHSYCGDGFVHVVYYKGGFFLVDGHNRVYESIIRNDTLIQARLKFKIL